MLDINSCSLHQIVSVQGIENKLAENFVKYRRLHGRFRSFDEIWRVPGMNKSAFQIIAKHFRISLPKPVVLNAKVPQARLPLTESMIDFVCKGQSVAGSGHDMKTAETVPSGTTRNGTRYRVSSKEDQGVQSKDDLPMRVKITKKSSSNIGNGKKSNSYRDKITGRPAQKSAPKERETTKSEIETRHKSANSFVSNKYKIAQAQQHDQVETLPRQEINDGDQEPDPQSQNQPAITLVTTPSGNNINFSCTIDKRFLKHPTAMAFHFDDQVENEASPVGDNIRPVQNAEMQDVSASAINNKTLWQISGSQTKQHVEITEMKTALNGSTCTSNSSPLSQENVFLFERQNTQSPVEKKSAIDAWVIEVNVSRDLEAIYRRKRTAQRKTPGAWSPNSKKTLSPPPKKLLRRPVLEQNFSALNSKTYCGKPKFNQPVGKGKTYGGNRTRGKTAEMSSPTKDKSNGTPMTTPGIDKEKGSESSSDAGVPAKALYDAQRAASIRKHMRQVEQPGRSRYGQGNSGRNGPVRFLSDVNSGKKQRSETQCLRIKVGPSIREEPNQLTARNLIQTNPKTKQNAIKKSHANGEEEEVCIVM